MTLSMYVADPEETLSSLVREPGRVCERRKLKVIKEKSKVLKLSLIKWGRGQEHLQVRLGSEELEVSDFKCFRSMEWMAI